MKGVNLNEKDIFATLDIRSLYPRNPIDQALDNIAHRRIFPQHDIRFLKIGRQTLLSHTITKFMKQQVPHWHFLTSINSQPLYETFERRCLNNTKLNSSLWSRYVEDILGNLKKNCESTSCERRMVTKLVNKTRDKTPLPVRTNRKNKRPHTSWVLIQMQSYWTVTRGKRMMIPRDGVPNVEYSRLLKEDLNLITSRASQISLGM